jgi:hypothetical protein
MIFQPLLALLPDEPSNTRLIICESDALSPTLVLHNDSAKAPIMQEIHEFLEDMPQYQEIKDSLFFAHIFGPGNCMSDP